MALEDFRERFSKMMMELIGTMLLVLIVQLAFAGGAVNPGLVIGLGLVTIVYCAFPISGGHVNPAISFGLFLRGKLSLNDMLGYWIFQVAGGLLGAVLGVLILGTSFAPAIGKQSNFLHAFLAELVWTAILVFVVLAVVSNSKVEGNSYYALAIGITVYVGVACVGPVSGGSFNPAVAIGLIIVRHFWKFHYALWVTLANLIGAAVGTLMFYIVAPDEFEHFGEEVHALAGEARNLLPSRA